MTEVIKFRLNPLSPLFAVIKL